jgi:uncharacterized coiled-coil protein SlyX
MPVLQTFADAGKETPERQAAAAAMQALRAARRPADNLKELRDTVLDLQKEIRQLRQDLDTLQNKLQAKPAPRSSSKPAPTVRP